MKDADDIDGIFSEMEPMPGAIEGFNTLVNMGHDVYILSTAPWKNPSAWSDKLLWVFVGWLPLQRLIHSHNKNLNHGDFLIDDRVANGASAQGGTF